MSYRVIMTARAQRDVAAAHAYIAESSPLNAQRWVDTLYDRVEGLSQWPRAYPVAEESIAGHAEYRKMTVGNYLVYYEVAEDRRAVHVLRIWHAARDRTTDLFER